MTEDQVREINAMMHVENELIDQACGRVLGESPSEVGNRGPMCFSPLTTASCRATSAWFTKGRIMSTR